MKQHKWKKHMSSCQHNVQQNNITMFLNYSITCCVINSLPSMKQLQTKNDINKKYDTLLDRSGRSLGEWSRRKIRRIGRFLRIQNIKYSLIRVGF